MRVPKKHVPTVPRADDVITSGIKGFVICRCEAYMAGRCAEQMPLHFLDIYPRLKWKHFFSVPPVVFAGKFRSALSETRCVDIHAYHIEKTTRSYDKCSEKIARTR